jgi:hypothetical protein
MSACHDYRGHEGTVTMMRMPRLMLSLDSLHQQKGKRELF